MVTFIQQDNDELGECQCPDEGNPEEGAVIRSGGGSGEKREAKVATIDLTEETEVHQRRVKTVREREIEAQHGGKKLKKEELGQALVKEIEKGEDAITGGEKDAGAGHHGEIQIQAEKGRGEDTETVGSGLKVK
ncbi:hypothetical protein L1987_54998 [Smallanthus sonchifolius]|uniref:Uncharacterized protein n=1 Tax=Smallanthus sonchifolius TaxID=185202 RepID=A0ACB9E9R0_9ASTR|nr:hypothetical protein L1987_54998 [Smallanthus sonchifolius]